MAAPVFAAVIDTLPVADAKPPESQSEGPPNGQGQPQNQGKRDGTAVKEDADQAKNTRLRPYRVGGAGVLFVVALGLVGWLFVRPPGSFAVTASVVVAAAVIFGAGAVLLPSGMRKRLGTFAFVAGTMAAVVAAVLAIPARPSPATGSGTSNGSSTSQPPESSSAPDEVPFTWDLDLTKLDGCEGFVVSNSLLNSLPEKDKLNAGWAYENGGATANNIIVLTIQGNSEDAVVLKGISIVEVEPSPAPSDISAVFPCHGQGGHMDRRYYEVVLDKHASITARPGRSEDDEITEPIKDFPFKVSNSDPEYFEFDIAAGPPCLCSWKIAVDWTSRGRAGTTIIGHGSSSIRTVVTNAQLDYYYRQDDGSWSPPLPK
jgi:hypothetical protein